jgi:hypothetical protein
MKIDQETRNRLLDQLARERDPRKAEAIRATLDDMAPGRRRRRRPRRERVYQ